MYCLQEIYTIKNTLVTDKHQEVVFLEKRS